MACRAKFCSDNKKVLIYNFFPPNPKKCCFNREKVSIVADNDCNTYWDAESAPDCDFIKGQGANGFYFIFPPDEAVPGTVPISGAGKRLMYHSYKSAFRSGEVSSTLWDEANIGLRSFASGFNTLALTDCSVCFGFCDDNSVLRSKALGSFTTGVALNESVIFGESQGGLTGGFSKDGAKISNSGSFGVLCYGMAIDQSSVLENSSGAGGSLVSGFVSSGGTIQNLVQGGFAQGNSSSGALISNNGKGGRAFGCCEISASITNSNSGGSAGGFATGASSLISNSGNGGFVYGSIRLGGTIINTGRGGLITGHCEGIFGQLSNTGQGGKVYGNVDNGKIINSGAGGSSQGNSAGINTQINNSGFGGSAQGRASTGSQILNTQPGGFAEGNAIDISLIQNSSIGGKVIGFANSGGTIESSGSGNFTVGTTSSGIIRNNGIGSILAGFVPSIFEKNSINDPSIGTVGGTIVVGRNVRNNNSNAALFGQHGEARTGTITSIDTFNSIQGTGSVQIAGGSTTASTSSISVFLGTKVFSDVSPLGGGIAKFWNSSGADYAEFFEWDDGNSAAEDRVGFFVTIAESGKIKKTSSIEDRTIGVVSASPGLIGDSAELAWAKALLTDKFGRTYIYLDYRDPIKNLLNLYSIKLSAELEELYASVIPTLLDASKLVQDDKTVFNATKTFLIEKLSSGEELFYEKTVSVNEEGNVIEKIYFSINLMDQVRPLQVGITNPAFNPDLTYIPRNHRKEWSMIGLIGKLYVYDNGECQVGRRCSCGVDGKAYPGSDYFVLERMDEKIIRILFK